MTYTATGQNELIFTVTDRIKPEFLIVIDINSADAINKLRKGIKVDLGIILNGNTDQLLHCFSGEFGSAAGKFVSFAGSVSCVDATITKARDIYPQIARD